MMHRHVVTITIRCKVDYNKKNFNEANTISRAKAHTKIIEKLQSKYSFELKWWFKYKENFMPQINKMMK